jgi:hypothetical protein
MVEVSQVGEDGEDAAVVVGLVGDVEFAQDAADVGLDGFEAEVQPVDDALVGGPSAMGCRTSPSLAVSRSRGLLRRRRGCARCAAVSEGAGPLRPTR